jgi:transcriptional regulator with XRE-family HTH domain
MVGTSVAVAGRKRVAPARRAIKALQKACDAASAKGLTQAQVEDEEGLARGYLSHVLAGKFRPGADVRRLLQRRLHVPVALWAPPARKPRRRR